jgi:hypothetical protein
MVGLYTKTVKRQVEAIDEDSRYYNLTIAGVKTVDELLTTTAFAPMYSRRSKSTRASGRAIPSERS